MILPRTSIIRNIVRPASAAFGVRPNNNNQFNATNGQSSSFSSSSIPVTRSLSNLAIRTTLVSSLGRPALSLRTFSTAQSMTDAAMEVANEVSEAEVSRHEEDPTFDHPLVSVEKQSKSIEQAIAEFEQSKESKQDLQKAFEQLLMVLSEHRDFHQALSYLNEAKQSNVPITAEMYALVIRAGRRTLRTLEIRELFGTPSDRPVPSPTEQLNRDVEIQRSPFYVHIKQLLEEMTTAGFTVPMWLYEDLAYSLQSSGQAGVIVNLAITLEDRGITPSTRFYNRMLYALPRSGFSDRADVLFARMIENKLADVNTYIIRMGSLTYTGRYSESIALFEEASKLFPISDIAYNSAIQAMLQAGQPEKAVQMLERMKTESKPNHITANQFVTYYYNTGETSTAKDVLGYFLNERLYPSTTGDYATLFKFYSRHDPVNAVELLKHMGNANVKMDALIYSSFLSVLIDRKVLGEWKRKLSLLMVPRNYPINSNGLASHCMSLPFGIRQVLARMEAENIPAGSGIYDLLLRAHLNRRDFDGVKRIWSLIQNTPGVVLYTTHRNTYLMALLNEGGNEEEIKKQLEVMRTKRASIHNRNAQRIRELGIPLPYGSLVLGARNSEDGHSPKFPIVSNTNSQE